MADPVRAYPVILQTDQLVLTLAVPEAAPRVVAFYRRNWEFLAPWSPPLSHEVLSVAQCRRTLEQWRDEEAAGKSLRLDLFPRDDARGPLLGRIGFTPVMRGPFQACFLGFMLDHQMEGRGLMREALETAIPFLFRDYGLHRIQAAHLPHNLRSARLLKHLGFIPEGYARDYLYIDGAWRDHVLTALTNPHPQPPGS